MTLGPHRPPKVDPDRVYSTDWDMVAELERREWWHSNLRAAGAVCLALGLALAITWLTA